MYKIARVIFSTAFVIVFAIGELAAQNKKGKLRRGDSSIIKTKAPKSPKDIVIKYGIASFYAQKFNGRKTSNGNVYSSVKLTAACNVLPLGIWVKVTNLRNEKSVIVYVNDRLHPKNPRLIDLSRTAAEKLGFIGRGLTRVKVEVLGKLPKQ
ncbi:MAG: septal ring lytic transglycosylase RlpA family protein [Chitinophagaceae bacterium]